jgi:hypothetical protein
VLRCIHDEIGEFLAVYFGASLYEIGEFLAVYPVASLYVRDRRVPGGIIWAMRSHASRKARLDASRYRGFPSFFSATR